MIYKMKSKTLFVVIAALLLGCAKNQKATNKTANQACGATVVVSQSAYNGVNTVNYSITNAVINGNCLEITFGSSGCSGGTWVTKLVDSGAILDSNPMQRMLKLDLTNNELCTAVFTKTVSFDISPLKVDGSNTVRLVLSGFNSTLLYQY
jgi:hypothetical protein